MSLLNNPILMSLLFVRMVYKYQCDTWVCTLGPAYNEFGYNDHQATKNRFLCMQIIDGNGKKFSLIEHQLITSSFYASFLLVVSGTQCNSLLVNSIRKRSK